MPNNILIVALVFLSAMFSFRVEAHDQEQPAGTGVEEMKQVGSPKDAACDCCRQCGAARKPVSPPDRETAQAGNGCGDCCERCGLEAKPPQEKIPPEIIKKQLTPPQKQ